MINSLNYSQKRGKSKLMKHSPNINKTRGDFLSYKFQITIMLPERSRGYTGLTLVVPPLYVSSCVRYDSEMV